MDVGNGDMPGEPPQQGRLNGQSIERHSTKNTEIYQTIDNGVKYQIFLPYTLKTDDVGILLAIGHGLTPLNALPDGTPACLCMEVVVRIEYGVVSVLMVLDMCRSQNFIRQY